MRQIVCRLPSSEHIGYIVKSEIKNGVFYFLTNQGIEFEFEDTIVGSKVRISYNGFLMEGVNEQNGTLVFNTDCLHQIFLKKILVEKEG